jgi:ribosome maturation factor RimP
MVHGSPGLALTTFPMVQIFYTLGVYTRSGRCPLFLFLGGEKMDPTIARIWELAAPLVEMEGMEIIDIELRHEGSRGGRVLRFYLDKEGGPNMDDLSGVSRELSDLLDVRDIVEGAYTLEVSSPGINRPLKRPEHFARFVGKKVRVRTRELINGRRSFLGQLLEVSGDKISLSQDGRQCEIPFSLIERSNYEHDWSA